jgi:signal transduction histidine kinase
MASSFPRHILFLTDQPGLLQNTYGAPFESDITLTLAGDRDTYLKLARRFQFHGHVLDAQLAGTNPWPLILEARALQDRTFVTLLLDKSSEDSLRALRLTPGWTPVFPPYPLAEIKALFRLKGADPLLMWSTPESSRGGDFEPLDDVLDAEEVQQVPSLDALSAALARHPDAVTVIHAPRPGTVIPAHMRRLAESHPRARLLLVSDLPLETGLKHALDKGGWFPLPPPHGVPTLVDHVRRSVPGPAAEKDRVLVVDDEPALLSWVMDVLEAEGYDAEGYASGAEALTAMKRGAFNAALLDYQLGDTTGLALSTELREINPDVSVVLMTAFASLDNAVRALKEDVHDYLIKPLDMEKLKASLARSLEKARLNRAVRVLVGDLQRTNRALSHANELKTRFLSIVSHDLRAPLTSIKGFAQILEMQPGMAGAQRDHILGVIVREADHLGALINDLMDMAAIEAGKLRVERSANALGEVLDSCVDRFQNAAREKGVRLETAFPPHHVTVVIDAKRVAQALTNLIGNALKHSRPGGRVAMRADPTPEGGWKVCVEDDGEGIPREDLPRIFDPFYQAAGERARKEGLGLGLTIAREIMAAHGGTLTAESEGPGKGSRFLILLPATAGV